MKTKFKANAPPVQKEGEFFSHVQDLTDDLGSVIKAGLTMKDGNLPFTLYSKNATSGREFEVTAAYATVVFSGAAVTKIAWRTIKQGLLGVTVTMDSPASNLVLLLVKETV